MDYNRVMPVKFLRVLAVALTLLVPIQAVATLTTGICMATGQHPDAAANEDHADPAPEGHGRALHSHAYEPAGDQVAHSDHGNGAHCGPCAACCASASIAAAVAYAMLSLPSPPTYVFSQFAPLGVQPDGVYRPPLAL
jgi:hypothetical protein